MKHRTATVRSLDAYEWYRTLPSDEQHRLSAVATVVDVAAGRQIIHEGTFDHSCMLILEGRAEVRHGEQVVRELGAGSFVGEIGSLSSGPRLADVWSIEDMKVVVTTSSELIEIVRTCPTVSLRLLRHLAGLAADGFARKPSNS